MRAASITSWMPCLVGSLALSCGVWGEETRDGGVPSLVLITLDTTNARALDVYGSDRGITPNILHFAAEAQVFDAARTVAPLTLPAHASMMTGLVPPRHGLRDNGLGALAPAALTLAESASESGRATAAFLSAAVLGPSYGLGQGFDTYDAPQDGGAAAGDYIVSRSGADTVAAALQWLDALKALDGDQPFFLWVHLFDPHAPYDAPQDAVRQTNGNLYLAEVASMDAQIGRLLAALPPRDECAVVMVADHGESLGRHGEPTHSLLIHDATMHVPFLVRWPDGRGAGTRSDAPVSVCDVFPTVLGLLGIADEGDHDGIDLAQPPGAARTVYFESYSGYIAFGLAPLAGVADGHGKWIGGPGSRFYAGDRVPMDPQSAAGIDGMGREAASYRERLEIILRRPTLAAQSVAGAGATMRALGYAGTGTIDEILPSPLEPTGRRSVADGLPDALACYEAVTMAGVGRRREALDRLKGVLLRSPDNAFAAQMLGAFLLAEGEIAEADRVLTRAVERGSSGPDALATLAEARLQLGQPDDALRYLERAIAQRPSDPEIRRKLVRARAATGR